MAKANTARIAAVNEALDLKLDKLRQYYEEKTAAQVEKERQKLQDEFKSKLE